MILSKAKYFSIVLNLFVLLSLASCVDGSTAAFSGEEVEMRYATLLSLKEGDGFTVAELKNPWDSTKVLHRYVLVPKEASLPASLPEGDVVRTPVSNMLCYVAVHASLFNELGALDAIKAVGDAEYMYIDRLQENLKSGKVLDCGTSKAVEVEKIIDFSPDAVVISAMEDNNSYAKLLNVGIPVVECADYMETGPLQRAEWMRFYGRLVGKGKEADSLFLEVENAYNGLKDKVKDLPDRPTVVDGKKLNSSWYVAGSESTVGRMIADAGGDYVFKDEASSGSVPYSPEIVLDRGAEADIWMVKYYSEEPLTYEALAAEWPGYTKLKAFQNRRTYVVNLNHTDFYMATPFHPEVLLREYVRIFHPSLFGGENRYYLMIE